MTLDPQFPGILGELAATAGKDAALALAKAYGGRQVYIPRRMRGTHRVALAIGLDAARALAELRGPGYLDVPLGPTARERLGSKIQRRLAEGIAPAAIARELGCSRRTVYRHRLTATA